jgi:hypothetical protein
VTTQHSLSLWYCCLHQVDAAGATVQIFMFAILACKVKQNAPRCHTFLEIIQKRYGTTAHIVFIFFALFCNILVASQLLLGGSAVVTALTGMNVYAAIFLIPLGVCVYVVLGGLRATFLCMSPLPSNFVHSFGKRTLTSRRRLHSHFYPTNHHSVLYVLSLHHKSFNWFA